jgi:hypothetical protein
MREARTRSRARFPSICSALSSGITAEDCTFETKLKRFGSSDDKGLRELAEIVHDIDLKDDKFHRLEGAALNAIIMDSVKC